MWSSLSWAWMEPRRRANTNCEHHWVRLTGQTLTLLTSFTWHFMSIRCRFTLVRQFEWHCLTASRPSAPYILAGQSIRM